MLPAFSSRNYDTDCIEQLIIHIWGVTRVPTSYRLIRSSLLLRCASPLLEPVQVINFHLSGVQLSFTWAIYIWDCPTSLPHSLNHSHCLLVLENETSPTREDISEHAPILRTIELHNMRLFAALLGVLISLNLTLASPAALASVQAPDTLGTNIRPAGIPGGLYACQLSGFKGLCGYFGPEKVKNCTQVTLGFPNGPILIKPLSLGPDEGGYCDIFRGNRCNDQTFLKHIVYPGISYHTGALGWESVQCYNHPPPSSSREESAVDIVVRSEDTPASAIHNSYEKHDKHSLPGIDSKDFENREVVATTEDPSVLGGVRFYEGEKFTGASFWTDASRKCIQPQLKVKNEDGSVQTVIPKSIKPDKGTFCRLFKTHCLDELQVGYSFYYGLETTPNYNMITCCSDAHIANCWQFDPNGPTSVANMVRG